MVDFPLLVSLALVGANHPQLVATPSARTVSQQLMASYVGSNGRFRSKTSSATKKKHSDTFHEILVLLIGIRDPSNGLLQSRSLPG